MNAKTAKKIRRKAEQLTRGQPERVLIGKRVVSTRYVNASGTPAILVQAVNDPRTTRGIARAIKKGLMAEQRRGRSK